MFAFLVTLTDYRNKSKFLCFCLRASLIYINPLAPEMDIYSLAHHLQFSTPFMWNVNILWTKKGNIRKYTTFCGGINEDGVRKSKK